VKYANSWKESHGDTLYAWLTTHTSAADVHAIVKALGRKGVWKLRGEIYADHGGAGTSEGIEELEKVFDKAEFKGRPMKLSGAMPDYLVWVTKQQSDHLVDKVPEDQSCHDRNINTQVRQC
jgi:hypothetical protein